MKNRIIGYFLVVIIVVCNMNCHVYAKEVPDELKNLYARSAVLMDADSGRILFGKNESEKMPMASTTKIMTCILALENMKEKQLGIVSEYAVKQPKVHLGVREGEKYYILDLLYSLMLESHNDSAVIIAETIGGTVKKFAAMMNRKAKEIGCTDTYFITPNGLDEKNEFGIHSTTAKELALIMRYCIQESPMREKFLEITQKKSYKFKEIDGKREFYCNNHNQFLDMMEGALTGKTGFTNDAGYCYVGALRKGKRTFIVTLLGCGWPNNKNFKWEDTKSLMKFGLDNYEYQNVFKDIETKSMLVSEGFCEENPYEEVFAETRVDINKKKLEILMKQNEEITIKLIYENSLHAPVKKNEVVGRVMYMLNNEIIKTYKIVTNKAIEKKDLSSCMGIIGREWMLRNTQSVKNA